MNGNILYSVFKVLGALCSCFGAFAVDSCTFLMQFIKFHSHRRCKSWMGGCSYHDATH